MPSLYLSERSLTDSSLAERAILGPQQGGCHLEDRDFHFQGTQEVGSRAVF